MLDNYDSFTYNLVQYLSELGAEVTVSRNDEISIKQIESMNLQAVVLSPGPGRPENSGILLELINQLAGKLPILGVCIGHQAIAQVYGGIIGYAPTIMHGKTSEIFHDGSILFRGIQSPFTATRYHSLAIEPKTLPKRFKRTAWTDDGVIMGLECTSLGLYGLQFHPESILTVAGKAILRNFLENLK